MNKICVLIPYFKGAKWLPNCLESLRNELPSIEAIYVIDNCPETSAVNFIPKDLAFNIHVLQAKPEIGFARACNVGFNAIFEASDCTKVFVLNQDTKVKPGCIEILSGVLDKTGAFAASALSTSYDSDTCSPFFIKRYIKNNFPLINDLLRGALGDSYEVNHKGINGAAIMLSRSLLSHTGWFDPTFDMYHEDRDLFFRAEILGLKLVLAPNAIVQHFHTNASLPRIKMRSALARSHAIFCAKKHGLVVGYIMLLLGMVWVIGIHIQKMKFNLSTDILKFLRSWKLPWQAVRSKNRQYLEEKIKAALVVDQISISGKRQVGRFLKANV